MQIICNNCGNELTFPSEQHLVTCPQCLTHLEIEETDSSITATIVESPKLDNSIFENNQLTSQDDLSDVYNLLHLENQYTELLDDNSFRSILMGKNARPIGGRGILRIFFGFNIVSSILYSIKGISELTFLLTLSVVFYGIFLMYIGIKELKKWRRVRQFEKYYFDEQKALLSKVEQLKLSPTLEYLFEKYKRNSETHLGIRRNYFRIKIGKYPINIGASVLSQGFRWSLISAAFGFIVVVGTASNIALVLATIVSAILGLLGFRILLKSTDSKKYVDILNARKEVIQQLNDYLRQ